MPSHQQQQQQARALRNPLIDDDSYGDVVVDAQPRPQRPTETALWRQLGLWVSFAGNIFVGVLYVYPAYSNEFSPLVTQPNSQLVQLGVASQFALAAGQLPFGQLYNTCSSKCGNAKTDKIFAVLGTVLQVLSSCAIAYIMRIGGVSDGASTANFWLLFFAMVLYGCGNAVAFGQGMWLNGYNFKHNLKQKSTVIAAISFAQGIGAITFTVLYPILFDSATSSTNATSSIYSAIRTSKKAGGVETFFWFSAIAYLVCGVLRFFVAVRLAPVSTEKFEVGVAPPRRLPLPWKKLFQSPVFWLCAFAAFCGIGVGGAFGSLLGTSATDFVTGDAAIALLSDYLALTFLSGQVLGRLVATLWYWFFLVQSKTYCGFIALEFIGAMLFLFMPESVVMLYVSSAIVGTGFGGILCTCGPVVAAHFPGGNEGHFPVLFGMLLLFPSIGLLVIGKIVGALTPSAADCWVVNATSLNTTDMVPMETSFYDDCRFSPTLTTAAISLLATISAGLMGCLIHRASPST